VYPLAADNDDGPFASRLSVVNPLGTSIPKVFFNAASSLLGLPLRTRQLRNATILNTPVSYPICGCGHGGTRNISTSRRLQT
jgi:hypothetical protein